MTETYSMKSTIEKLFRALLPSPFTIALLLTGVTAFLAFVFQKSEGVSSTDYLLQIGDFWYNGIWNKGGMVFLVQMMLMLILGHVLALTPLFQKLIKGLTDKPNNTAQAAALTAFFTIVVSFFNWGLGLIFGAILAKTMKETLSRKK
jgi:short-chain fatty acids transporter